MIGYNETTDLTAYATARGVTLTGNLSVLLTKALDWLELQPFSGSKTDPDQALEFPRDGAATVPDKIKTAQLVAAMIYDAGGDPMAPLQPRVLSERVEGAVAVTYSENGPLSTLYPQLTALLRGYLAGGSGANQFAVVRA
jgi:hypothetical protein